MQYPSNIIIGQPAITVSKAVSPSGGTDLALPLRDECECFVRETLDLDILNETYIHLRLSILCVL